MRKAKRLLALILGILLATSYLAVGSLAWADQIPEGDTIGTASLYASKNAGWEAKMERKTFSSVDEKVGDLDYIIYSPIKNGMDADKDYPLLFLLHGANASFAAVGAVDGAVWASEEYQELLGGAYLVFPVANEGTGRTGTWMTNDPATGRSVYIPTLKALIGELVANENINPDKIALGGVSAGGFMAWQLLIDSPDLFACAYPMSAAYAPSAAELAMLDEIDVPIWIFHAMRDELCPYTNFIAPVESEYRRIDNIRFTLYDWLRFGDKKIVSVNFGFEMGQHATQYSVGQNLFYADGTPYDPSYPDGFVPWLLENFGPAEKPLPDGASFEQLDDIGAEGSKSYIYIASELNDPPPMLTPILFVYADKGFATKEDAWKYIADAGLVDLAEDEMGVVIVQNPVGSGWSDQDIEVYVELRRHIHFYPGPTGGTPVTYQQMQYQIGEGSGATFINEYMSQNAERIAGVLTVGGEMSPDVEESVPLPAYIAGGASGAVTYFKSVNYVESSAVGKTPGGADLFENELNPVQRVVVSGADTLNADVINDAWSSIFRRTVRQCIEKPQPWDAGIHTSTETFTLMDRPVLEELGVTRLEVDYVPVNGQTGGGWFLWLPDEAIQGNQGYSTGAKFPLVITMHGTNDHPVYEAECNGWADVAGAERIIIASPGQGVPAQVGQAVHDMIDELVVQYPIDESRIYLTGFSLGGSNTAVVTNYDHSVYGRHSRFAGVAPMGSSSSGLTAAAGLQMPYLFVTGTQDMYTVMNYPQWGLVGFSGQPAIRSALEFNGIEEPEGELDSFWKVVLANSEIIQTKYGPIMKTATYYTDDNVPLVKLLCGENMDHAHFMSYGEIAWDYFKQFSRDTETKAIDYTPNGSEAAAIDSVGYTGFRDLVAGCAANIPVNVAIKNPDTTKVFAGLFIDGGKIAQAEVTDGRAIIRVTTGAKITDGQAYIAAWFEGKESDMVKTPLDIVELPANIWTPVIESINGGKTTVSFDSELSYIAGASVKIGSAEYSFSVSGNKLIVDTEAKSQDIIVIKGVKYPNLFPSYSFTFTLTAPVVNR